MNSKKSTSYSSQGSSVTNPKSTEYSTRPLMSPLNRNNSKLIQTSVYGPRSETEFEPLSGPSNSTSLRNTLIETSVFEYPIFKVIWIWYLLMTLVE